MAAEHATKIYTVALIGIVVIVAFLAFTSIGHVIDLATQHFMLFYAGVFVLIALCTSVGLGLVSTDRMFLNPGQRVLIQSAHRAASFGALTFLIIHIVTEILAQRVHVIDAVVPFLSPFKTFYIGLGTIAGDIIILLAITGIMRGRFNANGKAWRWRAIHYSSYLCLVFGVWHGLLGGRPGKPYVDWSYGFVIAFVALGLAVRVLSNSLRPKENLSAPPVAQEATSASAPLRAAAMLAQHGSALRGGKSIMGAATGPHATMMPAPVAGTVVAALPAGGAATEPVAQPLYEPGYDGPPRYMGAPRNTGPMPRPGTGPMPRSGTGSMPRIPAGPTGPMPRHPSGPIPRAASGPLPRSSSGPDPRDMSGPLPRVTGSFPAETQSWTGPMPRATGAMPQADDGWDPRPAPRPAPRGPAGPPRGGTGPTPAWGDPGRRPPTGPMPRSGGRADYQDWPDAGYDQRDAGYGQPGGGYGQREAGYDRPDAGYGQRDAGYDEPGAGYSQGWPGDQAWLEASHDGGRYAEQPPWDGYLPEPEADIRYREPGPGMPGYRGSREHRYGGDRY